MVPDHLCNINSFNSFPGGSGVKNLPAMKEMQEIQIWSLGQEDPQEKEMATHFGILAWKIPWTEEPAGYGPWGLKELDMPEWLNTTHLTLFSSLLSFPGGSDGKESANNAGDLGSITGLGRFPGERNGNPLQYSCLENSMGRGAWQATVVHGVAKSSTLLSD